MYEVRVLCSEGYCQQIRDHMKNNGYKHVTKQTMAAADHYGILTADDIDDVVDTASKLKQVFPGKIVKLKVIEMQ